MRQAKILAAIVLGLAAGAGLATGAFARQDDILKNRIDDPKKDHWTTQGTEQKTSVAKSDGVPGGFAYRVKVNTAGPNDWSTAASTTIAGPIKKGDVVLFAFWARAEKPPKGAEAVRVNARVQQSAAPYTGVVEAFDVPIGPEWKMYFASGKSPIDLGAGQANAAVHLGKAVQTVDLGPSMVLDFGPDYPLAKLPKN
ncbi:carbohydrate binding domain-containing protein [Phenylobacterium deserti]|nr:carbohydrate binding domain-containing protein [Phenylobacterium deserti]